EALLAPVVRQIGLAYRLPRWRLVTVAWPPRRNCITACGAASPAVRDACLADVRIEAWRRRVRVPAGLTCASLLDARRRAVAPVFGPPLRAGRGPFRLGGQVHRLGPGRPDRPAERCQVDMPKARAAPSLSSRLALSSSSKDRPDLAHACLDTRGSMAQEPLLIGIRREADWSETPLRHFFGRPGGPPPEFLGWVAD